MGISFFLFEDYCMLVQWDFIFPIPRCKHCHYNTPLSGLSCWLLQDDPRTLEFFLQQLNQLNLFLGMLSEKKNIVFFPSANLRMCGLHCVRSACIQAIRFVNRSPDSHHLIHITSSLAWQHSQRGSKLPIPHLSLGFEARLPVEIFEALVEGLVTAGHCKAAFGVFQRMKTWVSWSPWGVGFVSFRVGKCLVLNFGIFFGISFKSFLKFMIVTDSLE